MSEYGSLNGHADHEHNHEHSHGGHSHGYSGRHVDGKNEHSSQDGTLKAAVFGFSDGLCTNVNVILGMYAAISGVSSGGMLADQARSIICLTGICGMLGGASSMACGEWISANAEATANKSELAKERWHHKTIPEIEAKDMRNMMLEAGLSDGTVDSMMEDLDRMDVDQRVAFHARFELRIEEEDVSLISTLKNAGFMWVSFAIGGIIPLLPWLFAPFGVEIFTLFAWTIVMTVLAVLCTSGLQTYGTDSNDFLKATVVTFSKQLVVVTVAVGVTVGLNLMFTGSVAGG